MDDSKVTLTDDDHLIPTHQFSFMPINEILNTNNNSLIDVVGIVICVDPTSTIRRRDGIDVLRRSLKLLDMSTFTINVTLWGRATQKEGAQLQELYHVQKSLVLAIKNVRITEYNGKVVSTLVTTQFFINPEIEETTQVQAWFAQDGNGFSHPQQTF